MGNRHHILELFHGLDILETILPAEDGMPTSPDQVQYELLLIPVGWLMKMGLDDKKGLDEFIQHTLRTFDRMYHIWDFQRNIGYLYLIFDHLNALLPSKRRNIRGVCFI